MKYAIPNVQIALIPGLFLISAVDVITIHLLAFQYLKQETHPISNVACFPPQFLWVDQRLLDIFSISISKPKGVNDFFDLILATEDIISNENHLPFNLDVTSKVSAKVLADVCLQMANISFKIFSKVREFRISSHFYFCTAVR